MAKKIDHFQKGNDSHRKHLNELVDAINDLESRLAAVEAWPEVTVVVHNSENTRLVRAKVKSLIITEDLGEIDCDCICSGGEQGDA